jgi:hypothetical protein
VIYAIHFFVQKIFGGKMKTSESNRGIQINVTREFKKNEKKGKDILLEVYKQKEIMKYYEAR